MPAVSVPDLKGKFRLLPIYTLHTSWSQLATKFGASHKTLQYWAQGSATREPEQIPKRAVPTLVALVTEMLPAGRSPDEIRRLVFGRASRLEEEVRSGTGALLSSIIAAEGRHGTAILIRRQVGGSLIEVDNISDQELQTLTAGTRFRVEFPLTSACGYAAALQNAQQAWAVLPSTVSKGSPARMLVPGLGPDEVPVFMRERRDFGVHRFVCLESNAPFPAWLDEHRREGTILDKRGLEELARFYFDFPKAKRGCQVLSLIVEPVPQR